MKVLFNTRVPNNASAMFYQEAFSRMESVSFYDYNNYNKYDIALFMTYKPDLEDLKKTKKQYPNIKTAIIDPRYRGVKHYLKYADFLIVDSIEMKDYWAFADKPILQYAEYPDISNIKKEHKNKNPIIIGYHGNKIHLHSIYNTAISAMDLLSEKYDIEFWAMYNISKLGKWKWGLPKKIKIRHIQWCKESYIDILGKADIGIVPGLTPVNTFNIIKKFSHFLPNRKRFIYRHDDYLTRYKLASNAGRIILWAKLHIPVIADFYPSALQHIQDGVNGLLAYSRASWYKELERLIVDTNLRQKFADNMKTLVNDKFDYTIQNNQFRHFLKSDIL